jgi:hypothetical protein
MVRIDLGGGWRHEMTEISSLVLGLWKSLAALSEEHEEVTDTDVREALHETLSFHFVWGRSIERLPLHYRMFTPVGDEAVSEVVSQFLRAAQPAAARLGIPVGEARLDCLQSDASESGGPNYYEFIGHVDEPLPPEPPSPDLFVPADYDDV